MQRETSLLEAARSLLFQANLAIELWGESILTAACPINLTDTPTLDGQSPFKFLSGKAPLNPTYGFLDVFVVLMIWQNPTTSLVLGLRHVFFFFFGSTLLVNRVVIRCMISILVNYILLEVLIFFVQASNHLLPHRYLVHLLFLLFSSP